MRSPLKAARNLFGQDFKSKRSSRGRNDPTYKLGVNGYICNFPLVSVKIKAEVGKEGRTECWGSRAVTAWSGLHPGFAHVDSLVGPQNEL